MDSLKDWPITLLITGLFLVCILTFASSLGLRYDKDSTYMKSDQIDLSRVESQVNDTINEADRWGDSFRSDNPFVATGAIILFSVWGIGNLIWDSVITFITLYFDMVRTIFGVPAIVTGTLTAIVIIGLIFAIWRLIKQGE